MAFTKQDITNLSNLARITIDSTGDVFAARITQDLDNILQLISEIQKVDTSNVAPLAHPLDMVQPLRADKVQPSPYTREELQQSAPQTEMGLYLVPQVIEE